MSNPAFNDLILSYYPSARWALDMDTVGSELSRVFHLKEATNSELCDAVRWLAGPEWKGRGAPGLKDLIVAVWVLRKQARQNVDDAPEETCGLCGGNGVVEFWPGLRPPADTLDAYSIAYSFTAPCGCGAGMNQREFERKRPAVGVTPLTDDQYGSMFRQARDQAADRYRLVQAMFPPKTYMPNVPAHRTPGAETTKKA